MGCASSSYTDEDSNRDVWSNKSRTTSPTSQEIYPTGLHTGHAAAFARALESHAKQQGAAVGIPTIAHANFEPNIAQAHDYTRSVTTGILDGGGGNRVAFPFHRAATGLHAAPAAVHGGATRCRPNPCLDGAASPHTDGAASMAASTSIAGATCCSSRGGARSEAVSRTHTNVAHHMDAALGLFDEDGLLSTSFSKGNQKAQHLRQLSSQLHNAASPARQHTQRRISTCSVTSAASGDGLGPSLGGAAHPAAHTPHHSSLVHSAAILLLAAGQQGKGGCVIKDIEEGGEGIVLQRHVGKGAFGEVYLGTYRGMRVAVKSVWGWVEEDDEEKGGEGGKRERMAQVEAVLMAVLDHPHIVTTMKVMLGDVGSPVPRLLKGTQSITVGEPDVPNMYSWYIVMEYCDLGSLWAALVAGTFHSLATREPDSGDQRPGLRRSFSDPLGRQSSAGTASTSVASDVLPSSGQLPAAALEAGSQLTVELSSQSTTLPSTAPDAAAIAPSVPQLPGPGSLLAVVLGSPTADRDTSDTGAHSVRSPCTAAGTPSPRSHKPYAGFSAGGASPGHNGRGDTMVAWDAWAALATLREMVSALQYMHHNGVVHGDIKAPNILLAKGSGDRRGFVCKVTDFGFSRVIGARKRASVLKTKSYGTVTHQPPELLRDGVLTPGADVYAVGITMWEVLTGLKVHGELSDAEVVVAVVQAELRPVWPPDAPQGYCDLASACWAADPSDRPSMGVVAQRLAQLQKSLCCQGQDSQPILLNPRFVRVPRSNIKRSITVPASALMPAVGVGSPRVLNPNRIPTAGVAMDRPDGVAGARPVEVPSRAYGMYAGHAGSPTIASPYTQAGTQAAANMQPVTGQGPGGFLYTSLPTNVMSSMGMAGIGNPISMRKQDSHALVSCASAQSVTYGCMTPSDGTASMHVSPVYNNTMWAALYNQTPQHVLAAASSVHGTGASQGPEAYGGSHAIRSAYSSGLGAAASAPKSSGGMAHKHATSHGSLASLLMATSELQVLVEMGTVKDPLLRSQTAQLDSLSGPGDMHTTQQAHARAGHMSSMQATVSRGGAAHAAVAQAAAAMLGMRQEHATHGVSHLAPQRSHHPHQQHGQQNHLQPGMPPLKAAGLQSKISAPLPALAQSLPVSTRASATAGSDNAMGGVMAGQIAVLKAEKARLEAVMAARRL